MPSNLKELLKQRKLQRRAGASASSLRPGSTSRSPPDVRRAFRRPAELEREVEIAGEDEDDVGEDMEYIGSVQVQIVGLQYYEGTVNDKEMVLLTREPHNPYDGNAIRVDNVRGERVGHVERYKALHLAPLVDRGLARLEGVVPRGSSNAYKMPCTVNIFSLPQNAPAITQRLHFAHMPLADAKGGSAGGPANPAAAPQAAGDTLDDIFNALARESAASRRSMEAPPQISSPMFPHQKEALAWLAQRENSSALPPFWEPVARGGNRHVAGGGAPAPPPLYANTLTNFRTAQRPPPLRGGILADDMGLGKTLALLALIAANRPGAELPPVTDVAPAAAAGGASSSTAHGSGGGPEQGRRKRRKLDEGDQAAAVVSGADASASDTEPPDIAQPLPPCPSGQRAPQSGGSSREPGASTLSGLGFAAADAAAVMKGKGKKQAMQGQLASRSSGGGSEEEQPKPGTAPQAGGPRATLVVCPLSVVSSWTGQVEEHMRAGELSYYVYHGAERMRDAAALAQFDLVLTTYSTLAAEGVPPAPAADDDDACAARGGGRGRGGRGPRASAAVAAAPEAQVGGWAGAGAGAAPLQEVKWLRVVLDEAHYIKTLGSRQTRAALALTAERRWVVTGTPIQNKVGDLHSLLAFLRLQPLQERLLWVRTIERPLKFHDPQGFLRLRALVGTIALRRTKETRTADGGGLVALPPKRVRVEAVELSRADRELYDRWELEGQRVVSAYARAGSVLRNYAAVMCIITRLRQICDHASLCPAAAPDFLAPLSSSAGGDVAGDGDAEAPAAGGNTAASTEMLERLLGILREGGADDCPICLCAPQTAVITRCAHIFCRGCIRKVVLAKDSAACPLCRTPISAAQLLEAPPQEEDEQEQEGGKGEGEDGSCRSKGVAMSAKIAALLRSLAEAREADPGVKSVVFSLFTAMLSLIQRACDAAGIRCARLDGSMSAKRRDAAMAAFRSTAPSSPHVILVSIKAAGVGVNLVAASRVYVMDPWWNPAVEEQAIDRVHRLGQTRAVEVIRYAVADSIEERMLQLQEKKRELALAAFEHRSLEQQRQMRLADVRLLMRL